MKRTIALVIFLFTSLIGFNFELQPYIYGDMTLGQYQNMAVNVLLLAIYIVPATFLLYHFKKKWKVNGYALTCALFGGGFLTGWFSSYGNEMITAAWGNLITNADTLDEWSAALSAPFVEEFIKIAAVLLVVEIYKISSAKSFLLLGVASGLGFQIIEDISYISLSVRDTPDTAIADTFSRIAGSLSSHWAYTATLALACFLLLHYKQLTATQKGLLFAYASLPVLIHFIWNSPLTLLSVPLDLIIVTLSTLNLLLFLHACQTSNRLTVSLENS